MTKAEQAALKAHPKNIPLFLDENIQLRYAYKQGYEQAEKDMKERFIQFVHSHYPINYIGWIQDFQKEMEDEK